MKKIIFFVGLIMTIGSIYGSDILSTNFLPDADSIKWVTMNTIHFPTARTGHAITLLPDGHVLLFGGKDSTRHTLNDTWLFGAELHKKSAGKISISKSAGEFNILNPEDWTPVTPPSSPDGRQGHSMVTLPDGRVLLFGGIDKQGVWLNDLHSFESNQWSQVSTNGAPPARSNHAAWSSGGNLYVANGFGGTNIYSDLWQFNPGTNSWTQLENPPGNISIFALPMVIHNFIAFVDIHSFPYSGGTMYCYDMSQQKWEQKKLTHYPQGERAFYCMVQDNEKAYFFGGGIWDDANQRFNYTNEVWKFDYSTLTFSQMNSLPYTIYDGKAIFNPQSKNVVLWGGKQNDNLMFPANKTLIGYLESKPVDIRTIPNLPSEFNLAQNYPNPFNPTTTINYSVPKTAFVTMKVYDVLGREITTLVNEEKQLGIYEIKFDGNNLTSGVYYYQIKTDEYLKTKKMVLIK